MSDKHFKSFEDFGKSLSNEKAKKDASSSFADNAQKVRNDKKRNSSADIDDADDGLFFRAMERVTPLGEQPRKERRNERETEEGFALLAGLTLPEREGEGKRARRRRKFTGIPPGGDSSAVPSTRETQENRGKERTSLPIAGPQAAAGSRVLDDEAVFAAAMMRGLKSDEVETPSESEKERALFSKAMKDVRPISARGRDLAPENEPKNKSVSAIDPAQALYDIINGKLEFALQLSDEYLEGFVVGMDPIVMGKLRSGQYSPEAHLDLHGKNAEQAFNALIWFIKNAYQRNLRTIIIVTGRGKNSPEGIGILRNELQNWLTREPFKRVVMAFCTAQPRDGGPGAVYVLLRKHKKGQGKILWERWSHAQE